MFGYIYKVTDKRNGMVYCGRRNGSFDPEYYGSGVLIVPMVRKHGTDNFSLDIVDTAVTAEELDAKEKQWIAKLGCKYPNGYNLTDGGDGLINPAKWVREKIGKSGIGRIPASKGKSWEDIYGVDGARKMREAHANRLKKMWSGETRKHLETVQVGRKHSLEHRNKISEGNKKLWATEQHKEKMLATHSHMKRDGLGRYLKLNGQK